MTFSALDRFLNPFLALFVILFNFFISAESALSNFEEFRLVLTGLVHYQWTIYSFPQDIKRMVDNILEVCRVLLNSNSFLRFLEKILAIGNMMNAAIKKTCKYVHIGHQTDSIPFSLNLQIFALK